jgi:hypothetical protein
MGLTTPVRPGTYATPATSGTLSSRPAATVIGQRFLATDTVGGTLYESLNGSTWTQVAAGVGAVGQGLGAGVGIKGLT